MRKLVESIDRCIAETVAGDRDYFEELRVDGRPELWLQVSWDMFNLALKCDELPAFGVLPQYVQVEEWKARNFVMLSHGAHDSVELAGFLLTALETCWGLAVDAEKIGVTANSRSAQPPRE